LINLCYGDESCRVVLGSRIEQFAALRIAIPHMANKHHVLLDCHNHVNLPNSLEKAMTPGVLHPYEMKIIFNYKDD